MLPAAYGMPAAAAVALVLGGALACFAGYRLLRIVLGIYGFIVGAAVASSVMGISNTLGMIVAALLGGLIGAFVLVFAYLVGIALVGAGLGVLIVHVAWAQMGQPEPPAVAIVVASLAGAASSLVLQRYVIIVGTAFGGAWTMIVGAANLFAERQVAQGASDSGVWILYPTSTPDFRWAPLAWLVLGSLGTAIQLRLTGRKKTKKK
jgi:hypothetical protein